MPENYFVLSRRETKSQLLDFLIRNSSDPVEKSLAVFSFKTGFRVPLLRQYLDELKDAGLIQIEKNSVVLKEIEKV